MRRSDAKEEHWHESKKFENYSSITIRKVLCVKKVGEMRDEEAVTSWMTVENRSEFCMQVGKSSLRR